MLIREAQIKSQETTGHTEQGLLENTFMQALEGNWMPVNRIMKERTLHNKPRAKHSNVYNSYITTIANLFIE